MKNFSETVRSSADIIRVVSDYVALKGTGGTFKGLCPFHSEKTPSFSVHREKQLFHCFGCGAGGDVFSFVMLVEKVSFPESVRMVAEKCAIPIPTRSGLDDVKAEARKQLLEVYERASAYFCRMLAAEEGVIARQVLEKRCIQPVYAERFRLGYAPASGLMTHLQVKDPVGSGLFVRNEQGETYERFRRRLIFPIWNERGKIIAFGGRALRPDAQPKYLNSAESSLYSKSHVLYALHLARSAAQKAGRFIVVEGYFDCLSLHQAGIENAVASCGTSLTHQQVSLMARYVPEVVMNYDPDGAGKKAVRRSIELLLARGLRVRILNLPGGLDPDDFVRKEGAEAYGKLLTSAPYFWEYLMSEAAQRYDLAQPAMKATAVNDVVQFVGKIQDRVEQLEVARALAEGFKVPEPLIFERLNLTPGRPVVRPLVRTAVPSEPQPKLTLAEKQLVQALIQRPEIAATLQPFWQSEFLSGTWSGPFLQRFAQNPTQNVETALEDIQDDELKKEIRAAVLEPFGSISEKQALASIQRLYDAYLVKKIETIREQLRQYGSGAAPAELVRKHMEVVAEKNRVSTFKA